jgi:hypothetical protein
MILKAQSSFEYVFLLGGLILLVLLVLLLLQRGAIPEAERGLANGTDAIASLKAGAP